MTAPGLNFIGINVSGTHARAALVDNEGRIVGFYLAERFWISPKVEEATPERLQELEHAATEKLQDLREEIQEHIPFKQHRGEHKERKSDGD